MTAHRPIIFFDFDGTVTTRDLVEALLREFRPDASAPVVAAIKAGHLSLKTGVAALYDLLPTSGRLQYIQFVRKAAKIRPGFDECVAYLERQAVEYYIVSNGLDSFITPILGDRVPAQRVYCNRAVWTGPRLAVDWPYPCSPAMCAADCGLCKPTVMRWLTPPGRPSLLVGDGVTDLEAARRADWIVARDQLADRLSAAGRPYRRFEDFHDVQAAVRPLIEEGGAW